MIATNFGTASNGDDYGGSDCIDDYCAFRRTFTARITDFDLSEEEIAERNRYIRQCRLRLFAALGAFVLDGRLVYWKPGNQRVCRPAADRPATDRRPAVILAGYMSEARGRHWDRKRR